MTFEEAKEYTITVDARSSNLFIDKMVLRRSDVSDSVAFDLLNNESSCYDSSLSFDLENKLEPISIYPNPTDGLITIKNGNLNTIFTVSNIQGVVLCKFRVSKTNQTFDISDLSSGVYFLNFAYKKYSFVKKIIKI